MLKLVTHILQFKLLRKKDISHSSNFCFGDKNNISSRNRIWRSKNRIRSELLNCMNACPILLHYSLSRINDQTWWQSQSEEETEPTKEKVTGPSTTDVSTEGSLLSTEQSHTWETPKSSGISPENVCWLVKTLTPPYGLPTIEYSRLVQKHRGVLTHKKQSTIAKVCTKGKKETAEEPS